MSSIDIREQGEDAVDTIVFADAEDSDDVAQAHHVRWRSNYFTIEDSYESVVINSKEHALDLIKAIKKAIELEWVK